MIETNWEHIIQLTLEEINDIISDKDKAYLYHLIAEDEEVYQLYMRTHSELGSDYVRRILEDSTKKRQSKNFVKFAVRQAHNWWRVLVLIVLVKSILIGIGAVCLDRWYLAKKKAAQMSAVSTALTTKSK